MPRQIRVDRNLCMGSGQCTFYASHTFALDDTSIAIVLDPSGADPDQAIEIAISGCPSRAISMTEEGPSEGGAEPDRATPR